MQRPGHGSVEAGRAHAERVTALVPQVTARGRHRQERKDVKNWGGRFPGGKAAHDEFGAILSDIRHYGITTTNDRKRLRALAHTFGWSEHSIAWLERTQHRLQPYQNQVGAPEHSGSEGPELARDSARLTRRAPDARVVSFQIAD